jgi:hypothetical protein
MTDNGKGREEAEDVGAAWREAEAALPDEWRVMGVSLTVQHLDHDDWEAVAAWSSHDIMDEPPDPEDCVVVGPTPAAALRALAAALTEPVR